MGTGIVDRAEPTRAGRLASVGARFTRRWTAAVGIGIALAVANGVAYELAVRRTIAVAGLPAPVLAEFERLRGVNLALSGVTVLVFVALALWFFRPLDRTLRVEIRRVELAEAAQAEESERRRFDAELAEALDMTADEQTLHQLVRHVLGTSLGDRPAELLLAGPGDAHLTVCAENPVAGRAGCQVASASDCPAVRRSGPIMFPSSNAVNACPHLRDRPGDERSALCVPLAVMGRAMGVLHATGEAGNPPDGETAANMASLARQVGNHLGTLRAFASVQVQATTDSLTGLPNRRSVEDELSRRLASGERFSVAMADLDDFKQVNDAFGHDAGDQALRAFADTARRSLREDDLCGRWGGDEFVIALPGMRRDDGVEALDRIRVALAEACAAADVPSITASFGVVDTDLDRSLEVLLRGADEGLAAAKRSGKDKVVVGMTTLDDPPAGTSNAT